MRIISGHLGGRQLSTGEGDGLRPAMAKTREAIFSMLESRGLSPLGGTVLDLFAGCGSLGLECLSRGASLAWFVDNGKPAITALRKNMNMLAADMQARILQENVLRFLARPANQMFSLVFIDPPYRRNLLPQSLELLEKNNWLLPGATVVAEAEKEFEPLPLLGELPTINRLFGQTRLYAWTNPL